MRKFFFVFILSFFIGITVNANEVIYVTGEQKALVNGEVVCVDDRNITLYPFVSNDRLLIPVRGVSEFFNAEVLWDGNKKEITVNDNSFKIGEKNEKLGIDVAAKIVEDITFVPVRAVAQNMLNKNVYFESNSKTIIISDNLYNENEIKESADKAIKMIKSKYLPDGSDINKQFYTINGRTYRISKFVKGIPLIEFNYLMMDEKQKKDITSLMDNIEVKAYYLNAKGEKEAKSYYLDVRKELVSDVKEIFNEIYLNKGLIKPGDIGGFRLGSQDFDTLGRMTLPNHPNGVAIDINAASNPYGYYNKENRFNILAGLKYNPYDDLYCFDPQNVIVQAFKNHGWGWGGDWNSWKNYSDGLRSYRDYMHFSINGY